MTVAALTAPALTWLGPRLCTLLFKCSISQSENAGPALAAIRSWQWRWGPQPESMLKDDTLAFLIRWGLVLLARAVWSQPIVRKQGSDYRTAWVAAWKVDAGDCDVQAYGLLFKRACED